MPAQINKLANYVNRWFRKRFAFPLLLVLAAALVVVSEDTYRDTTSTLRAGIELTDARIQSLRLFQLVTEAEAAQFGFLATGQPQYLTQYAEARENLPGVVRAVTSFFGAQGAAGMAAAQRVADFTQRRFAQFDRALELARAGQLVQAKDLASGEQEGIEKAALRAELRALLAGAAGMQQQARTSIYDALLVNRIAVGALTLGAFLSLFLLLRQIQIQDRERGGQQSALLEEREHLEAEVKRRTARLTELAKHLQSVSEDERSHLARELHDELGGLLTASKLEIARARSKVGDPAEILVRLERIGGHLNQGIALKRRIIEDLRPSALSDLGLTVALANLCHEMGDSLGVPVRLLATEFHLSPEEALAVYRFVQEALTNIGKYASASQVDVTLTVIEGNATVEVHDDGAGFDPQSARVGRHGLSGMQFRAESLGGSMRVSSVPGQGTTVRIEFPQSPEEVPAV